MYLFVDRGKVGPVCPTRCRTLFKRHVYGQQCLPAPKKYGSGITPVHRLSCACEALPGRQFVEAPMALVSATPNSLECFVYNLGAISLSSFLVVAA